MSEPVFSYRSEKVIATAKEAFSLGLISEHKMKDVIRQAETNPEYNGVVDLPFEWEIEAERKARADAARPARKGLLRRLFSS